METLFRDRTVLTAGVVWLILMSATWLSWSLGPGHTLATVSAGIVDVLIIAIAMIKVQLVGMFFMELRSAPRGLQLLFHGLLGTVCAVLVGALIAA